MIKLKPSLVYSIDLFSQLSIFLEYMLKNNYIQFLSANQKEAYQDHFENKPKIIFPCNTTTTIAKCCVFIENGVDKLRCR